MTGLAIGSWTRRGNTRWHLVESIVADAAITRCGRRMEPTNHNGELDVSAVMPLTRMPGQPQNCKRCDDSFRAVVAPADDRISL